jgi:arylsulfatase A-like enzyme
MTLRRPGLLLLLLLALGCDAGPEPGTRPQTPSARNIVLILADDVGYGDLGAYGNDVVRTPHLDRLAAEGIRFTQAYVSAPLCAPSRAALLTGRDHNRYGYDDPGTYASEMSDATRVRLSRDEVLLSNRLRQAGRATGVFGKWHLGSRWGYRPHGRGFDTFFGHLSGGHDYFDWRGGLWGPVYRDGEELREDRYLTDATAEEAVAFIEHRASQPFFAYVPFTAIHPPFQAPEAALQSYAHLPELQRTLAAMITALDEGVGSILDALDRLGIAEQTLVIFLSDNGGHFSSNGLLHGGKGNLLEGGIRVPLLARWTGVLPAGAVFEQPVSSLDVVPTVLAAAGLEATGPALDGVDLLPYLRGERADPPHEALFWRFRDQWAVRVGPLKPVHVQERPELPATPRLYDLAADVGETRDLSAERPRQVEMLMQRFRSWERSLEAHGTGS